jgi:hypothetical protein
MELLIPSALSVNMKNHYAGVFRSGFYLRKERLKKLQY